MLNIINTDHKPLLSFKDIVNRRFKVDPILREYGGEIMLPSTIH